MNMIQNPNNQVEVVGYDDEDIGIDVFDERDNKHALQVGYTGEIVFHGIDDYPHKPEDRTQEEQRIMSQVEARARYAAQQEFPDEDILDPMWDIEHLEAGLEALASYDLTEFHDQFRDFYEALADPGPFLDADQFDIDDLVISKFFRFRGGEIVDVAPVVVEHFHTKSDDSDVTYSAPVPEYPHDEQIVCSLPVLDFDDDFVYEDEFQDIVVSHIMAQIRDLYFHMGEMPPEQYQVEGMGKFDIHGDGIGET
jgi:hypothetical protein